MSTDVWNGYVKQFNSTPTDATQLLQFSKRSDNNCKSLTFKESREIFNAHKTKPVVTNARIKPKTKPLPKAKPLPSSSSPLPSKPKYNIITKANNNNNNSNPMDQIKAKCDINLNELKQLQSIQIEFENSYNGSLKDIDNKCLNIIESINKRKNDLKKWRKLEYEQGLKDLNQNINVLNDRNNELNKLQNNIQNGSISDNDVLINQILNNNNYISSLNDFYLHKYRGRELQIGNILNQIFNLGESYNNQRNKQLITIKDRVKQKIATTNSYSSNNSNSNIKQDKHQLNFANSPFGQGKVINTNNNNNNKAVYNNRTGQKQHSFNPNAKGIKAFDIGNNAKYAKAQSIANKTNTNALPDNFWESDSDPDTEEERQETQDEIAQRWAQQKTNIQHGPSDDNVNASYMSKGKGGRLQANKNFDKNKRRSLYDGSSSDEDDDDGNGVDDDGFKKYIPPTPAKPTNLKYVPWDNTQANNTVWIIKELNKQFEYDTMWFKVPKMRNNKANGLQMKSYLQASGLSNTILKQIWKLSDLDKDGKMGGEEFALCMFLIEQAKNGVKLPNKLPKNYIPPSFRGIKLPDTPPRKAKVAPKKNKPPAMKLDDKSKANGTNNIKVKPKIQTKNNGIPAKPNIQIKANGTNNKSTVKSKPNGTNNTKIKPNIKIKPKIIAKNNKDNDDKKDDQKDKDINKDKDKDKKNDNNKDKDDDNKE